MDWEAIGSASEVVGAIAIVVTLIYLSIQTRLTRNAVEENTQHLLQQTTHSAVAMYSDWRRTVLATPELAKIIVRANSEGSLPADERLLFSICFQDLFLAAVTSYRSVIHNTAGHSKAIDVAYIVSMLKENPLAVEDWEKVAPVLVGISPEFVSAVNASLSNRESPQIIEDELAT